MDPHFSSDTVRSNILDYKKRAAEGKVERWNMETTGEEL